MLVIPLSPVPTQVFNVLLAGQECRIAIYQRSTGLYCNMFVAERLAIAGVLCRDRVRIVRDAYFGFIGDLVFFDLQGSQDPDHTGLGGRFLFAYIEETLQ